MNGLREKFRNKKGFTLIEMLIVVAIIAILVAVSIPLVSSALEKARKATDDANIRAAKAEGAIVYLDGYADDTKTPIDADTTYWYDAALGKLLPSTETPSTKYGQQTENKEKYIQVKITKSGEVTATWEAKAAAPAPGP